MVGHWTRKVDNPRQQQASVGKCFADEPQMCSGQAYIHTYVIAGREKGPKSKAQNPTDPTETCGTYGVPRRENFSDQIALFCRCPVREFPQYDETCGGQSRFPVSLFV